MLQAAGPGQKGAMYPVLFFKGSSLPPPWVWSRYGVCPIPPARVVGHGQKNHRPCVPRLDNLSCPIVSCREISKPPICVPFLPGEIPDLYSDDEVENIINSVRNEVKSQGLVDNRENCWKFFINRVRRQLKV